MKPRSIHMPRGLCCLLLIACLTAMLHAGLCEDADTGYFETVARLFSDAERYMDWSLARKLEWMTALRQYLGEDADPYIDDILGEATQNKEQLIDAYLLSRYGDGKRSETLNLHYCLVGELGSQHTWSLARQAWVSQLYLTYYPYQMETWVGRLPGDNDISEEQAVQIATDTLSKALPQGFDAGRYIVSTMFGVSRRKADLIEPYYEIQFGTLVYDPERLPYSVSYVCYITGDGRVMSTEDLEYTPSPQEQYAGGRSE